MTESDVQQQSDFASKTATSASVPVSAVGYDEMERVGDMSMTNLPPKNIALSRSMSMGHRGSQAGADGSGKDVRSASINSTLPPLPSDGQAAAAAAQFAPSSVTETFVLEIAEGKQKNELMLVWDKLQKKILNAGKVVVDDEDIELEL